MKIAYISNSSLTTKKAHGLQIAKMCEALADNGAEVELVLPDRSKKINRGDFFDFYGVKQNFKITKLPVIDAVWLGKVGFILTALAFGLAVRKYLKKKGDVVIYSRDLFSILFLKKGSVIFEAHYLPRNFIMARVIKLARKIVAITKYLAVDLKRLGVRTKIFVAPDGVDLDEFNIEITQAEARSKLNLPQDKKIIFFSGNRNLKWKGGETVIKAARNFDGKVLFVLLGLGQSFQSEQSIIAGVIIENSNNKDISYQNIVNFEFQPHSTIPIWLKAADVLLLPNSAHGVISKFYTSPLKMFEYMASQRPIVASNLPSLGEVLNPTNACLVEPDSPPALTAGIKQILDDPAYAHALSQQAFADVQKFTWAKRARDLIEFIKNE